MPTPYSRNLTPSSDAREEELLDDAIDDTFPASDPVSHGQPGSTVNRRYEALRRDARSRQSLTTWMLVGTALAVGVAIGRRGLRPRIESVSRCPATPRPTWHRGSVRVPDFPLRAPVCRASTKRPGVEAVG
jgi:hypothetical protein